MEQVVLVIHLILALAIIALVLLQRSEGGGLGIGGSGGMGNLASAGSTANALTKATAFCAAAFFTTSLVLGILAGTHSKSGSIMDALEKTPAALEILDEGEVDVPALPATEDQPAERPSVPME
ncbi:MAG: preprotein translocase subunit SecG [Rhodospirillales bacterium]|nr:preprotein translocase subunit SecG [Rhodospirillales bacterium]MCB9995639.1 preprotein translocase subunit SecG [Rhodospirillales bacterium]